MLWREAKWFANEMQKRTDAELYPMLNIGSHTEEFRKREQPWIDRYLFAPARDKGLSVVHSDLQSLPGVDLVGPDEAARRRAERGDPVVFWGHRGRRRRHAHHHRRQHRLHRPAGRVQPTHAHQRILVDDHRGREYGVLPELVRPGQRVRPVRPDRLTA